MITYTLTKLSKRPDQMFEAHYYNDGLFVVGVAATPEAAKTIARGNVPVRATFIDAPKQDES